MTGSSANAPHGFGMSWGLALGAFAVFALLPQRAFHGFDTDWYAALLQAGAFERSTTHVAYLPVCDLVLRAIAPFGGGAVHAMLLASALASAVGVFCVHRAARLLVPAGEDERAAAVWVTVLVALTPAVFFFATAAEVHGVFFAGNGAAWWAFARWTKRPNVARAAVLGLACGAAASLHALGHVLPPMFVAIAAVQRRAPWRTLVATGAVLAVAHAATATGVAAVLGHGAAGQASASAAMLGAWGNAPSLELAWLALCREVLVPYAPWVPIALIALESPRSRSWALAFWVAAAAHAPFVVLFLAREGPDYDEHGGYLLPAALPAVLASVVLTRARWLLVAAALFAAVSIAVVVGPRWRARYELGFVAAVQAETAARPVAFLVGPWELEGIRTECPGVICAEVERSLAQFFSLLPDPARAADLPAWFDAMLPVLGGPDRAWLATADAQRRFRESPDPRVRALWNDHVARHYELLTVATPGLEGAVLLRRAPR